MGTGNKTDSAPTGKASVFALPPQSLKIVSLDPVFAPGVEENNIVYNLQGLTAKKVWLEIKGTHTTSDPIFKIELTDPQKTDGDHTFPWNGMANAKSGDLTSHLITPLCSPYTVHLFCDTVLTDSKTFKVLYHSLTLAWGKHTADGVTPPPSDKTKYVQCRLNDLGYDAGRVDGTEGPITKLAVKRFQRANYEAGTQILLKADGVVGPKTLAALQAATAREIWESGKMPLTQDAKFYIYDNFMNDPDADFVMAPESPPEFSSMDRKKFAEDKMTRPYIALEAEILLQNKAGAGVSSPGAVGKVPTAWEVDDATEDDSAVTNATAKTYAKNAREIGGAANIAVAAAGAARIDDNGDNALATVQGIRRSAPAEYIKAWLSDVASSRLDPYAITGYDTEIRAPKTFHRAIVKAYDEARTNPRCRGKAGLYFRHSIKGGDDAKIRVSLSFKGLPNQAQLEADHAGNAANLVKETGRWTVWRRARVSAYCTQIAAPGRGLPNWASVRDMWKEAFIEIENGGAPLQIINYATVVDQAAYNAAIVGIPVSHRPAGVNSAADLNYSATCIYGGAPIPQNPGETAEAYVARAGAAMLAWITHPLNAILRVVYDEARKTSAEGFVIFDFRVHDAVTGQDWDGAAFQPSANPAVQNYIEIYRGYVRCAGAVTMNVDNDNDVSCYVLHECGHGRFLYHHITDFKQHWDAVSGQWVYDQPQVPNLDNPNHHDHSQPKCAMSYPAVNGDGSAAWQYHFCGKCLLRLRGWDITKLPSEYT